MWKLPASTRRIAIVLSALAVAAGACSGSATSTTTVVPPSTLGASPATVAPASSSSTIALPSTTTTTSTSTTTLPSLPTTSSTEAGSTDTTPATIAADIDFADACAVAELFVDAVDASDFDLAFALVHPFAKAQPPLGTESGVDRFFGSEDPGFQAFVVDVAEPAFATCRFLELGESFGGQIGAVELSSNSEVRALAMRTEESQWRIDELSDHVLAISPPPGSVQPSFAGVAFSTPLGTFDIRMQVDGQDVFSFEVEEGSADSESLMIRYAPQSGFGSGDHSAIVMTVLENGLMDAEAVNWSVP